MIGRRSTLRSKAAFLSRFAGALLTLLLGASVQSAQDVFTPNDVARIRTVASVTISPDGARVAYELTVPRNPFDETDGPAWSELHVVDRTGEIRPYVTGQTNLSAVAWTPDGKGLSFLAKRKDDEHRSLYRIELSGGEARRIVSHATDIVEYVWSPDSERVAYLATQAVNEEIRELEEKGFDQIIYEEDWRPVRIWLTRPEAREEDARLVEHEGSASSLHWSPVGSKLAVTLAPTSLIDDEYMRRKLHILDAEEGTVLARFDNPGKIGKIAWSTDGRHVAAVSGADPNDPFAGRLMVASSRGGVLTDIMPNFDLGHVNDIVWHDAETLAFLAYEGLLSFYGRVSLDGSGLEKIVPLGGPILRRLSLSADSSAVAFLAESPKHPREVFYMKGGDAEPRRLTHSNSWFSGMRLARQEVVRFKARDGLELEGLLIRPLDEEEGVRYPLILNVHGGPDSHYSHGWLTSYTSPGQIAAARGFVIFYPNYRGSTGRGVRFSKHGHADAAGKEFDDLVDAVDHLIGTGLVDGDRVGITGSSYGGYASAWGATYYSDRFAAAVMSAGISDAISKVGTTDIPYEMFMVHHRKWLWDDWEYFMKRSPIYYVNRARTPILILHGAEDPRVHPSQAMELYRHLKVQGKVPVRLVLYRGEGHAYDRAASRLDRSSRTLRWLEHYLKGPGGDPPSVRIEYERTSAETAQELGIATSKY